MKKLTVYVLLSVLPVCVQAQTDSETPALFDEILVTGGAAQIERTAGSATLIEEEKITEFDITDVNDLLAQVPGVYIRYEDGYGLRPNIGIRGATSERSQKITLMEDGILISPAPYSAPAAYYIPNVNRMSAVEVFKGPSSIAFGPHTVGGAMNMATPSVAAEDFGFVDLSAGSFGAYKGRAFANKFFNNQGFWLDVMRYGADGFKELDNGQDTGFERNDINFKWQWQGALSSGAKQQLVIKLGYADELSDETYLGLSEDDFAVNPNRRYIASSLDQFDSEHTQLHGLYSIELNNNWEVHSNFYVNRFDRSWNKFDGFFPTELGEEDDPYLNRLAAADVFLQTTPDDFLDLVRGTINSNGSLSQTLDITDNSREYGSQGLNLSSYFKKSMGAWYHEIKTGLRFHHDYVDRDHSVAGYWAIDGQLINDGVDDYPNKALNKAETNALAFFVNDQIEFERFIFNVGVRHERIEGEYDDELNARQQERSESIWLPGVGVHYEWTDSISLLLGINRGFSPNAPTAEEEVDPETSVNYEYGLRYRGDVLAIDAIGFFSDYQNLVGRCRVSDPNCGEGSEFNGGDVEIAGLEFTANAEWRLGNGLAVPIELVYTYTESAFQTNFVSSFSQWGDVQVGDELPYLPEHQGRVSTGLEAEKWRLSLALDYIGKMREQAGQGVYDERNSTEAYATIDLAFHYMISDQWSVRLVADNVTNEQEIVSRRPFGARPNSPRTLNAGVKFEF